MQVVTAIFADRSSAIAARELLGEDHYSYRWLAVTQPADHADADGGATEAHQLAESSDGALGALGRFLSGAGSSLQRALIDHNVTHEDAQTVDEAIGTSGAVLVIHSGDRAGEAAKLLEGGGGRVVSITTSGTVPPIGTAHAPGFHAVDAIDDDDAFEDEEVFRERRV